MALRPEVQAKAQAEIDQAAGDHLPTAADLDDLPYLNAIIKEILRWHVFSPTGGPRRATQDDVYKGHLIPAGATVFVNSW